MKLAKTLISSILVASATGGLLYNINSASNIESSKSSVQNTEVKSYILQGTTPDKLQAIVETIGGNVSREFPIINAVSAMLTEQQAKEISDKTDVRVQDDRTVTTSNTLSLSTTDSLLSELKMDDTKDVINNFIAEQTGADRLHDMGIRGKNVTVAVLDSGANTAGKIGIFLARGTDGSERAPVTFDASTSSIIESSTSDGAGQGTDGNGHGTHVSNIIASSRRDLDGNYNGIAPDVNLMTIKAFDQNGVSSYSKVLTSLNWIYEVRHDYEIRVVNMSLGAKVQSYYWDDPINQAVMKLWEAGIVVVSSAGNNGQDMGITVPGNNPYIITVGAATDGGSAYDMTDDRLTSFSAKGPTYEGFVKPEVIAYGANIATQLEIALVTGDWLLSSESRKYVTISGTSQAAAVVSGIAALIISNDPLVSPDDVKCRIMQTAVPATDGERATYSPFQQGAGLVNAYGAVMSNANNCANTGLNIQEDLMGVNHFIGPSKIDDNGNYYIELNDGTIFTEGMHWGSSDMNLNGMHWGSTDMRIEGLYWGNTSMELNGLHWGSSDMNLQGLHWGDVEMSLKGLHWGGEGLDLNGMDFTPSGMNLTSADLSTNPVATTGLTNTDPLGD